MTLLFVSCADDPPGDDDDTIGGDGDADADAGAACGMLVSREGTPTGIEACPGPLHEADYYSVEDASCATSVDEGSLCGPPEACPIDPANPSACAEGEHCAYSDINLGGCVCERPCARDDDCGDGFACVCEGRAVVGPSEHGLFKSRCVPADCRTDADCPEGRCAISVGRCTVPRRLACRGEDDACSTHRDCAGGLCSISDGEWACVPWQECE